MFDHDYLTFDSGELKLSIRTVYLRVAWDLIQSAHLLQQIDRMKRAKRKKRWATWR